MLTPEDAKKLGASDMPALLGLSDWGGPVALWARMVHGFQGHGSEDMDAGNAAEDYNRALYRNRTGYSLLGPSRWTHPMHPWLRCSPDDRATTPGGRRLVELKRYNSLQGWGPEGSDIVPMHIWVQVQVQAGVGLDNGEVEEAGVDVSALLRGELRLYHVPHLPDVYERCLDVAGRFVRDFVVPARFPDGLGLRILERDAEALAALFPAPRLEVPLEWAALPQDAQGVVRRWLEANRARKAWAKQEEALSGQVAALLREVPGLTLPEGLGKRVDFKAQNGVPRVDFKALHAALENEDPALAKRMRQMLDEATKRETVRPLVAR
jgi:hypothetical protein